VVAAFNPVDNATTWVDRKLHVNGKTESNDYHDLVGWTSPKFGQQHHGSNWFMRNQQRDEHNSGCTKCHGLDLLGGTVGVSCSNSSCHGGDWKSCDFCHGTKGVSQAPPIGVANETATNTLGVGRHKAHLTATASHVAFACTHCHTVPPAGNVDHAMQYVYSANLASAGHHGDVAFSGGATGMTFNVNATAGNPVNARGACVGSCHSNGRGGNPVVTPYWAGGNWTVGSCGNCHAAAPNTGRHADHDQELGCTGCHPAASSSSHMNGTRDVLAVISGGTGGGSITTKPPGTTTQCTTRWACAGTCHGDNHNNVCW
jgi:predicted CxxxxCH...CXXCH cytochrome family protein